MQMPTQQVAGTVFRHIDLNITKVMDSRLVVDGTSTRLSGEHYSGGFRLGVGNVQAALPKGGADWD